MSVWLSNYLGDEKRNSDSERAMVVGSGVHGVYLGDEEWISDSERAIVVGSGVHGVTLVMRSGSASPTARRSIS